MTPSTIAHYRIVSSLGAGGMGEVYLAEDTRLDRLVAIKLLRAELVANVSRLRRFEQEARAVSALNHPNIVTIHEIGETDAGRFIVLEYVKGQTLRSVIGGRQGLQALVPIGRQVATALSVAHNAGMVHRDIKPENIMLRDDGYVKVLDFGLARLNADEDSADSTADTAMHTKPGTLVGTVAYMSPEQVKGHSASSASDVFSLGVIFYEMATGRKPFKAPTEVSVMYNIVHDRPPSAKHLNPELASALDALIFHMIEKDARHRPTAAEVAALLSGDEQARSGPVLILARAQAGPAGADKTVGRAAERAKLRAAYEAARGGRGSIICVTGEAGIGKTRLVEDVIAELRYSDASCLAAYGQSSERLAGAEAYLPFLEALDSLIRSSPSVAVLMKATAPSWYVQLATSMDSSVDRIVSETPTVSQERMKRELAAFLQELSAGRPLVLFLDDLHWADASTIDIIAYIATKVSAMRLLIIATYRPSEMLLHQHPFLPVSLDMQARGVSHELQLGLLLREDVDRYLALEFPDHRFPPQFGTLIFAKTEGNPLFMADVVRYLRDKRVIDKEDGRWSLVQTAPQIETDLPETVRSMIQRKVAQLQDVDRRVLVAASAQGYDFDSAVVARALQMDPGDVEERLQALDQAHGFVTFRKEDEFPDHTLTLRYRFVHVLYQNALYATLTPSRRASTSGAIAEALLGFYGADHGDVASELAFLFQAARDWTRAAEFFLLAARNAARVFANQEAIALCHRGLDMNRRMPDGPDRARLELRLHLTLGPSLMTVKGFAASETLRAHLRARELCEQLAVDTELFRVLFGLAIVSVVRAECRKALQYAEDCLRHAERSEDGALLVQAHWVLGLALQFIGDLQASREHFERSLELYDATRHATHALLYGAILNRMHLGRVLLYLGFPVQAHALEQEGIRIAETVRHPLGLCNALSVAITIEAMDKNAGTILDMSEQILFYADEHGLPYYVGIGTIMRGWARALQGFVDEGVEDMRSGLAAHRSVETEQQRAFYLTLMADALCAAGRAREGLEALDEAIAVVNRTEERYYEAEIHRTRGDLLVLTGQRSEAEAALTHAMAIAHSQHAAAFEVRAATALARLLHADGRDAEAVAVLGPVYEWFTEGLDTPDLAAARSVLDMCRGA